ncbi:uncharacterized protein LODBEIA_P57680 [Lodderomyces beijingensis]|uniref:Leo1-like protein n=1 Tax=Lodderomyces beijingensis TaxID=1775926 RepID=A0ABP0ZTR7_9ASCO
MSDEEPIVEKEEMEDLFGDEEEEEEEEEERNVESRARSDTEEISQNVSEQEETRGKARARARVEEDDDDEEREEVEDEDEEEEVEEEEKQTLEISLPRHAISSISEGTKILRTPAHLNIDPHPFDPSKFKEQVEQKDEERTKRGLTSKQIYNDQLAEKLINETTVRWRYHNSGNDEIIKQSNAHFVQWDDGSVSLKIGNEMFDVKSLPVVDTLLVRLHKTAEILQGDSLVECNINLLPASNDSIHKKLLQVMKNVQFKDKILSTTTDDDPLKKQRLEDENERKRLKMKRQLENKRRQQEEKWDNGPGPGPRTSTSRRSYAYDDDEEEDGYDAGGGEYDEGDDFVAGDEEDIEQYDEDDEEEDDGEGEGDMRGEAEEEEEFEKGAERLRKLKQEGSSRYKETEEDTRKRRRIIDSDDE